METHLTEDPQITFFRNVYRRHTASTPDITQLYPTSDGQYCVKRTHGDLLMRFIIVFYGCLNLAADVASVKVDVRSGERSSIVEQIAGFDLDAEQTFFEPVVS